LSGFLRRICPCNLQVVFPPGESGKPSLLTQQGCLCLSDVSYNRFALPKEGRYDLPQHLALKPQTGVSQTNFPLGPVRPSHSGQYRCYGGHNFSSELSAPSNLLYLLVAGIYRKPSLSALPSPVVTSGGFVTLQCISWKENTGPRGLWTHSDATTGSSRPCFLWALSPQVTGGHSDAVAVTGISTSSAQNPVIPWSSWFLVSTSYPCPIHILR
uniref:Immunoglobulin domain-containing protein n=1 Tax=Equus asinus asinus TaxID=83772 RepID=A0A8C4MT28_EQUAS